MNEVKQREAIAQACGWSRHSELSYAWVSPKQECPLVSELDKLPDYLNDLNAMHQAEKTLSEDQLSKYLWNLYNYSIHIRGILDWKKMSLFSSQERAQECLSPFL